MPELILFDLDGTLADTAPDLALALNMQRERHGLQPLSLEAIRPHASHGSRGLLAVGFGMTPEDADFAAMRDEYLGLYDEVFTRAPQLFGEMDALLSGIEARGKAWGVVTNKPRRFSAPLMQALNLHQRAACLVCGDDVIKAKEDEERLKNEAQAYANAVIPEARGRAQRMIEEAEAYRAEVVARAEGESDRFERLLTEYKRAPAVTRERLYIETLERVMGNTSKVMVDVEGGNNMLYLPLDRMVQQGSAAPATNTPTTLREIPRQESMPSNIRREIR